MEKTDLVRMIFDAVNERDVERLSEYAHPDFTMDWSRSRGPYSGVHEGFDEAVAVFRSAFDIWETLRWEIQDFVEVDETRVIAVNHVRVRGPGSGVEVEATGAQLWTVEAGLAKRIVLFQSKADALEAVSAGYVTRSDENR